MGAGPMDVTCNMHGIRKVIFAQYVTVTSVNVIRSLEKRSVHCSGDSLIACLGGQNVVVWTWET